MAGNEQLALFDSAVAPSAQRSQDEGRRQPSLSTHVDSSPLRQPPIPISRPAVMPAGCRWHEVETPLQTIGFMLRTSRRKTVGLRVTDDGLLITIPSWLPRKQLAEVVNSKAPWILGKLQAVHQRQQHLATADTAWRDGGRFPYLGVKISLAIRPELGELRYEG